MDVHFPAQRGRLVRAAARMLGGVAEAEDVVQDTYLRALEAGNPAPPDTAMAWLTTVMQHIAVDRLRRRQRMQRWLHDAEPQEPATPSAETQAALAQDTGHALRLLATRLSAADGAAVLLREVFEATYSEIAQASAKTEASCRQQVHRALLRLRLRLRGDESQAAGPARDDAAPADTDTVFHLYRQALQNRDAQALFAMLRQPATRAVAHAAGAVAKAAPKAVCQLTHVGGRLGLVLALDGQFVCVLPLGTRHDDALAELGG